MGRGAVLVEFWDFARVNSLRTMPYLKAWHERYAEAGLRVIGIHSPGYSFGRDRDSRRRAPWSGSRSPTRSCSTPSWRSGASTATWAGPGRYLFDRTGKLVFIHYGEGEYLETELAIQEHVGQLREPLAAGAPGGRAPACCSSRRPPTSRCRPSASGSSWCATGPTATTGSRPPTPARRRASASAAEPPTRCCPGPASSRGSTRSDGRVEAESPGLRLHGVQFTPAPPAPGESPSGA